MTTVCCDTNDENSVISLWLDDERNPDDPDIQRIFGSKPGMIWVKTAAEAIAVLQTEKVDFISLDHDLGTSATGYDVARWIAQNAYYGKIQRLKYNCHSMNPVGKKSILSAMLQAEKYWAKEN